MNSEISEALEDYRAGKPINDVWYEHNGATSPLTNSSPTHREELGKPCGIPSEIADTVIRICDFCGHFGLQLNSAEKSPLPGEDFEKALAWASYDISRAFVAASKLEAQGLRLLDLDDGAKFDVSHALSCAAHRLLNMCEANKIDLWKVIEIKAAYNKLRPNRHGGKAI